MDDEIEAMEGEKDSPEFTLAEIIQMENLFKEMREKTTDEQFCQELSIKFNGSVHRSGKPPIKWEQVQSWFRDKQTNLAAVVVPKPQKKAASSKTAIIKKRTKVPTIPASEAAVELHALVFEARSAKDSAWFDVASFLSYRFLHSGEMVVRVRFSGFSKEEDEWVSLNRAVRERSIPLEHSECGRVNVGDLVLCFRENEDHALYCDAHVMEIERKAHDSSRCTCIFAVCFDHDNVECKVTAEKLCYRPTKSASKDGDDHPKLVSTLQPSGMHSMMQLF